MHLNLSPELQGNTAAEEAARIVGKCVHCGFCNASCPTYRLLGDELDGPRGRIYLMKGKFISLRMYLEGPQSSLLIPTPSHFLVNINIICSSRSLRLIKVLMQSCS